MRQQKILSLSPGVAILSNKQTLSKTGLIWIKEVKTAGLLLILLRG